MAFDPVRYEQDVLKPLRRRQGKLPDDLLVRYAIEPGMSRDELNAHLRRIRQLWNQKAGGRTGLAQVCQLLLSADEELRRRPGFDLADPAWWQAQVRSRDQQLKPVYERLVADLRSTYGHATLITRDQLNRIAESLPELGAERVSRAAGEVGLRVIDAVELPTDSGLDRTAYRTLQQELAKAGSRTVVELLHPDLTKPFAIAKGFSVDDEPGRRLDPSTLQDRTQRAEAVADSPAARATKSALGILRTGVRAGADLRVIALCHIVDQLRAERRQGLGEALLVSKATALGVLRDEAALLVASLPAGGDDTAAPARGLPQIQDLLNAGSLGDARAVLAAMPTDDPDYAKAKSLVDTAQAELDRLLAGAARAVEQRREEEAERLLDQAARIDSDDEGLDRLRQRVPPAPPRDVSAAAAGSVVRLAWQAPLSRAAEVRYRVVRAEGRAPVHDQDGDLVAETSSTHAEDTRAPVARNLRYAVFARVTGRIASRPATSPALVLLPPVTAIDIRARLDQVTGTWQAHSRATEVLVRRGTGSPPKRPGEGKPMPVHGATFTDRDVTEGVEHFYAIAATYRDPSGRQLTSDWTVVSAVPRGAAQPVDDLSVQPLSTGTSTRVLISWSGAGDVRIRRAEHPPRWQRGDAVSERELAGYGQEVAGMRRVSEGGTTLEADVPIGQYVYSPFAIGGTGAVLGTPVTLGLTSPVTDLRARRAADRVTLTWAWPDGVGMAEVVWTTPEHGRTSRRISRAKYEESGCKLDVGPGGGAAQVRAIAVGPHGTAVSPEVTATVEGLPARLTYTIARPPGRRGWFSRLRVITLTVDRACPGLVVVFVVAPGSVLPMRPEQGDVLHRHEFEPGSTEQVFEIELPERLRKPYWMRCFVEQPAGVSVADPPVATMKVS
ncbi:fibronectin type III domain-containing protein [Flindersiella endophytica]